MPSLAAMRANVSADNGVDQESLGRQQANLLARGLANDPDNAQLRGALANFGPDINPDTLRALGLTPPEQDDGIMDRIQRGAMGGISSLFDIIDRPSQAVLQAGAAGARGESVLGGLWGGLSGRGERTTLTEAIHGQGAKPNGIAGAIFDFAGTVATDPTSYLTAGVKPLAQFGLRTLVREGAPEAAEAVARLGMRGAIREGLTSEEAIRTVLTRAGATAGLDGARLEGAVTRQFQALSRSGGGGIRFAGHSLPGTTGRRLLGGQSLRSRIGAEGLETFAREGGAGRRTLQDWLKPRAGVGRAYGANVVRDLGQAESAGKGLASRGIAETAPEIARSLGRLNPTEVDAAYRGILDGTVDRLSLSDDLRDSIDTLEGIANLNKRTGRLHNIEVTSLDELVAGRPGQQSLLDEVGGDGVRLAEQTAEEARNVPQLLLQQTMDLHKSIGFQDTLNRMTTLVDDTGRKLVHTDPMSLEARAAGATHKVTLPNGQAVYVPKVIHEEVSKNLDILMNDKGMQAMSRFLNRSNTLWRSYATVFPAGMGFFSRNAVGNVMNTFYAGMRNPAEFGRMAKIQATIKRRGVEGLTSSQRSLYERAIEQNVIDSGFFLRETSGTLQEAERRLAGNPSLPERLVQGLGEAPNSRLGKVATGINPANPENFALSAGRKVNTALENNARLALFADGLRNGLSAEDAAIRVKKYLFDYSDLTAVERHAIKPWIAFYTFMRNNVPLQVETLLKNPGKITGQLHAVQASQANLSGGTPDGPLPNSMLNLGGVPIGGKIAQIDLPLFSAVEQLGPIASTAESLLPGGRRFDPQEAAGALLGSMSGIRGSALKAMAEIVAERSLFNGADIDHVGDRQRTLLYAIFPGIRKVERATEQITEDILPGTDRAQLLNLALGIGLQDVNDQTQTSEMFRRLDVIEDIIREMGEVPTLEDLRDAGIVPERETGDGFGDGQGGSSRLGSIRSVPSLAQLNNARNG